MLKRQLLILLTTAALLNSKMVLKVWFTFQRWIGLIRMFILQRLLILVKKLKLWSLISMKNVVVFRWVLSNASPILGMTLLEPKLRVTKFLETSNRSPISVSSLVLMAVLMVWFICLIFLGTKLAKKPFETLRKVTK